MKETYKKPELEVKDFEKVDVLTASGIDVTDEGEI